MAIEVAGMKVTVGADIDPLQANLRAAHQATVKFAGVMRQATATALGFAGGQFVMNVFAKAVGAAQQAVIGFNSDMEQTLVNFEVLLKSQTAARQLFADLQRFAASTPFEMPQLQAAARSLLNARFAVGDIIPLMRNIGDVSAGSAEKINRITLAITQIAAKGRVQGDELLQLQEAGVATQAVLEQVAAASGRSMGEVRKALEQGKIGAAEFVAAFQVVAQRDFGGLMARQAQTLQGALSTITDNIRQFVATAFEPVFRRVRDLAISFAGLTSGDEFGAWAQRIRGHVEGTLQALGILQQGFLTAMSNIARIVVSLGTIILRGLSLLNPFTRHSPSLIEQMREGFGRVIPDILTAMEATVTARLERVGTAMQAFGDAASAGLARAQALATAETEKQVATLGGGAVAAYRVAAAALGEVNAALAEQARRLVEAEAAVRAQEAALRSLEAVYEQASRRVQELGQRLAQAQKDAQDWQSRILPGTRAFERAMADSAQAARQLELQIVNFKLSGALERARERAQRLRDALGEARDRLNEFTRAQLAGTQAFSDAAFANQQEANRLQLQINQARLGGASDEQLAPLLRALDELRLKGENIRLREGLELDPQRRALERLASSSKELTYAEAAAGITRWRGEVERLQRAVTGAEAAERRRMAELARLEAALNRVRLQAEARRLRWEIDTEPLQRQLKEITDRRIEAPFEKIRDGLKEAVARVIEMEPLVEAARQAQEAAALAVRDQRDRIGEMRDALGPVRDRWTELNSQAETYKRRLDEMVTAAGRLAAALAATGGAGAGAGADVGGGIGAGVETTPPWAKKMDDWATAADDAFRGVLDEWATRLAGLQTTVDGLNGPLQGFADQLSAIAGAGESLNSAVAAFTTAWNETVPPILTELTTWWSGPGGQAVQGFTTVVATDWVNAAKSFQQVWDGTARVALAAFQAWWDGPGGRLTRDIGTWFGPTALGFLTTFSRHVSLFVLGPLGLISGWLQSPQGQATLDAIGNWFSKTAPAYFIDFDNAIKTVMLVGLNKVWDWYQSPQGKATLDTIGRWFTSDAPTALTTFADTMRDRALVALDLIQGWWDGSSGKKLLDLITGWFDTTFGQAMAVFEETIKAAINSGPIKLLTDALDRILLLINRAIEAWGRLLAKAAQGLPNIAVPGIGNAPSPGGASREAEGLALRAFSARATLVQVYAPVTVQGSVIAEADLAQRVRKELLITGTRNGHSGLLGGARV